MKIILLISLLFTANVFSQSQIAFSTFSNGGEKQANFNFTIMGTLGQASIEQCSNTMYKAHAGFWQMYYQSVLSDVKEDNSLPKEFKLEQNYPNPFNPSTMIKFGIPEQSKVLIKIYDILGSEVLTLLNEEKEVGWYEIKFNAGGYSSGVYICRMQGYPSRKGANNFVSTKKMLMIK